MYTFQINPWKDDKVAKHTSTYWEIASDETFDKDKIVVEGRTSLETTGSLSMFTANVTIPVGSTYYVRATREFAKLPGANHTLKPMPIKALNIDGALYNNIVLSDSLYVETPFVYIDEEEFRDPNRDYFTIKTSKFRCKQDGHIATHWIIVDQNNDVLFAKLDERVDKLEYKVFKTRDIKESSVFIIKAIHVSNNMFESKAGELVINHLAYKFDIRGLMEEVPAYKDLLLYITPHTARNALINRIYFRDAEDSDLKGIDITPPAGVSTITIPGSLLRNDKKYYLDVFCYDDRGRYGRRRFSLTTTRDNTSPTFNAANFKLKTSRFNSDASDAYDNIEMPQDCTIYQFSDGTYLVPYTETGKTHQLRIVEVKRTSDVSGSTSIIDIKNATNIRNDIQLDSNITSSSFYIRMFNNSILLLDSPFGDNSVPTFKTYLYDGLNKTLTPLKELPRPEENGCIGISNAVVQMDKTTLWYIPVVTDYNDRKIYSLNLETLQREEVVNIAGSNNDEDPLNVDGPCSLLYNRRRGFVLVFFPNGKIATIDIKQKVIKQVSNAPFSDWLDGEENCIKALELSNGDYILINKYSEAFNATSDTANKHNIVYYDCELNKFTNIEYENNHNFTQWGDFVSNSPELFSFFKYESNSIEKYPPMRIT